MECPYRDLFIYYIQGCLDPRWEHRLGDDFLGNWEEDGTSFLFFSQPARKAVFDLVSQNPGLVLLDDYSMPYTQWQQDYDQILDIGRFSVCAPWMGHEVPPGKTRLWMDPGVVFGTGTHPTTRDCMLALELLYGEVKPRRVLDLGTGTGLLALAAVALGAQEVVAVDLNPLAAKTTARNVELNDMGNAIQAVRGSALDYLLEPADLVVANIHYAVMKDMVSNPSFLRGKQFILSGLLRSEIRDIKEKIIRLGAAVHKEWEQENTWFTIMGAGQNG
ncbi:MAG: 50S ribosomal protein L11 methyltransferase [Desulfatibacillum sp.]|nr:50S ribosomal protein L11 methyltransferase [Desulfatibacillum sp.]